MSENNMHGVEPIFTPWRHILLDALSHVRHRLLMVSPYIKEAVVVAMQEALLVEATEPRNLEVHVITRVAPDDLLMGASDIAALQKLLTWPQLLPGCAVEIRVIPNVHAKVWVCDTALAIVGSGNATPSGLDNNLEYGLAISNAQLVERILSDWQLWWDQAEPLSTETLNKIAQQLQLVQQSEVLMRNREQQAALQQELKTVPRPGKRITFKQEQRPEPALVKEQAKALSTASSGRLTAIHQAYTSAILEDFNRTAFAQNAITVPVADFWHALRWVLPFEEGIYSMIAHEKHPDAFLKLFWKANPSNRQEVQLIWADGKRSSQASLSAHCNVAQQSWAITLDVEQLKMFGEMLQDLDKEQFFTKNAEQHFYLLLNTERDATLSIAYLRNSTNRWSGRAMVLPCTLASIPGSFPTLRPPLSQITIERLALRDATLSLQREWDALHSQKQALTIVELRLARTGAASFITLSTGQIEAAITRTLPGKDCTIVGLEARIRLDFMALHQVVTSVHNNIQSWILRIDRYAEAIQFIPESGVIHDTALLWRHELRGQ